MYSHCLEQFALYDLYFCLSVPFVCVRYNMIIFLFLLGIYDDDPEIITLSRVDFGKNYLADNLYSFEIELYSAG